MKIPTTEQLKQALRITEQIESLEREVLEIMGGQVAVHGVRRKMSEAARARIGAAQRARWAKAKGKKRTMPASARAKIAAAAKARWKKAKAAGKNTL